MLINISAAGRFIRKTATGGSRMANIIMTISSFLRAIVNVYSDVMAGEVRELRELASIRVLKAIYFYHMTSRLHYCKHQRAEATPLQTHLKTPPTLNTTT